MTRSRKGAPHVQVDAARDVVTISGRIAWQTRDGGLDLARHKTTYTIEIAREGTPFDPGFSLPPKGTVEMLGRGGALRYGEPLAMRGHEAGDDGRLMQFRVSERRAPDGFGTEALAIKGPAGELSIKGYEGTFKSAAVIGFNGKMTAVTEVSILMRARLESPDGEVQRGLLLGVDAWKGELKIGAVSGAAQGSGAGAPGADVGGAPGRLGAALDDARDLRAEAGATRLLGGAEDDVLRGRAGDDDLHGRSGDDAVRGGRGDDRLHDGAGADWLLGGRGADVFVLSRDGERDVVVDFEAGRDHIDLTAFGRGLAFADLDLVARDEAVVLRLAGETLVIHGAEGALAPADLTADSFLFA